MTRIEKVKAEKVEASYAEGKLLIFAQGQMADTCIQGLRIVRVKTAVEPPKFIIERTLSKDQVCAKPTPWRHLDVFEIGVYRESIKFEDAAGVRDISVSWIVPLPGKPGTSIKKAGGGGDAPFPAASDSPAAGPGFS